MKRIELTQNQYTIVNDEDYEYLSQFKWYARKEYNNFYAARHLKLGIRNYKKIRMHREIMKVTHNISVDHINGDTLDNRKENLRICSHADNMKNRKVLSKNNKSGYKGVYWNIKMNGWYVQICSDKNRINIGLFYDIIEAAKAYNEAAIKYHGKFAKLNVIDNGKNITLENEEEKKENP